MSDELLTVQLTVRQARAIHSAAAIFSKCVAEINPEWELHVEEDGEPPALTTGLLALEAELMLA